MSKEDHNQSIHPLYLNTYQGSASHPDAPTGVGGFGHFTQVGTLRTQLAQSQSGVSSPIPHPASPAARKVTQQQIAAAAKKQSFSITMLPGIMTAKGWTKGAELMNKWFARSAKIAPDYGSPDTTTITMQWLLGFKRASDVFDKLVADRIWQNEPARKAIAKMLADKNMLIPNSCFTNPFGEFSRTVDKLDSDYINQRVLGMSWDLDDLNAALANFVFNVVVAGRVSSDDKAGKGYIVEIDQVGVYMKDSYDFVGSQFLGYWDPSDNSVSMLNPFSGNAVHNLDFANWRTANGMGGDFRVFSDLKLIPQKAPFSFRIP